MILAGKPHKRLDEPGDIADVIVSLCAKDGAWINGQTIFANGGTVWTLDGSTKAGCAKAHWRPAQSSHDPGSMDVRTSPHLQ